MKNLKQTKRTISLATTRPTTEKLVEELRQAATQCTETFQRLKDAYNGLKEKIQDVPAE